MREAVGAALVSNHLETIESRESAIDRVGALAHATKLGRLLFHWRYAGQGEANAVLEELLIKARRRFQIAKGHKDHDLLIRACKQAMREYYSPECRACGGAREVVEKKLRVLCWRCDGSGLERHSDGVRVQALRLDHEAYRATWEARLTTILQILGAADAGAAADCHNQLRST